MISIEEEEEEPQVLNATTATSQELVEKDDLYGTLNIIVQVVETDDFQGPSSPIGDTTTTTTTKEDEARLALSLLAANVIGSLVENNDTNVTHFLAPLNADEEQQEIYSKQRRRRSRGRRRLPGGQATSAEKQSAVILNSSTGEGHLFGAARNFYWLPLANRDGLTSSKRADFELWRTKRSLRSRPKSFGRKIMRKITPTRVLVGAHLGSWAYKEYTNWTATAYANKTGLINTNTSLTNVNATNGTAILVLATNSTPPLPLLQVIDNSNKTTIIAAAAAATSSMTNSSSKDEDDNTTTLSGLEALEIDDNNNNNNE